MANYTVKQLARLSGVSVRTLHYYDQIGLLKPADTGANGYRYYDRPQALRLQQILFYRDLGLPLGDIARTLDAPEFDMAVALKEHRKRLAGEIARYRRLIRTIDETLEELDGDGKMPNTMKNPFKGFAPEKQAQYESELIDRYGDHARQHIAGSKARIKNLTPAQMAAIQDEGHRINLDLVALIDVGRQPDAPEVQAVIARHHAWVDHFWTPDAEAYAGLGRLYREHADFRAFYDKYDPRLVGFLAEAMTIYAETRLG